MRLVTLDGRFLNCAVVQTTPTLVFGIDVTIGPWHGARPTYCTVTVPVKGGAILRRDPPRGITFHWDLYVPSLPCPPCPACSSSENPQSVRPTEMLGILMKMENGGANSSSGAFPSR